MSVIAAPARPTHALPGTAFTSLATPSRGSRDTAVWRVVLEPGTAPTPHSVTREEVFVVLSGTADVTIDGVSESASTGDAIVVPPGLTFELRSSGREPLELLCCMPVGGQGRLTDGTLITPAWAE